jgi:hypothetical protein
MHHRLPAAAIATLLAAGAMHAGATPVLVEIRGDVFSNQISSGTLGTVNAGETVTYSFTVDSGDFVNGFFPTRGYAIDLNSFALNFSGGASIGLSPSFAGPAYFVIRDNDPAVDGFFLSQGLDFPSGLDLDQAGVFGNFAAAFNVGYSGDTLSSLDILDAVGTYDFTGLKVFGMGVDDGPFEGVLGIDFSSMTISIVPAPSALALLGLGGLTVARRRR